MAETISKSMHNWRRYPSSNSYKIDQNVRFWIWRSPVAPSDAAKKKRQYSAQLQSSRAQQPQRYFGKFTSFMTLGAHKLVRSAPIRTTHANFDNCCKRYIATGGKSFVQVHIYVLGRSALNYCSGILLKYFCCLYEVVRINFSADFGLFVIFDRNFAKIANCDAT